MKGRPLSVVLVHGLGVTERIFFEPKKERLLFLPLFPFFEGGQALGESLRGYNVLSFTQSPYGTVEEESERLRELTYGLDNFALVAHSRGGIVARYAIQRFGIRPRCLVCLSTPHRGSSIAEFVLRRKRFLRWISPGLFPALEELKRGSILLDWLNGNPEKEASVPHFDIAGFKPFGFLRYMRPFLPPMEEIQEGKGDGLVSVFSARSPVTKDHHFFCLAVNHASILVDKGVARIVQEILTCISKGQE